MLKFNKLLIHLHFHSFVYHTLNLTRNFTKSTDGFNNRDSLQIAHTASGLQNHPNTLPPIQLATNTIGITTTTTIHPSFPNKFTVCTLSQIVHHLWNPLESFLLDENPSMDPVHHFPIKTPCKST